MSNPAHPEATDVGPEHKKLFASPRTEVSGRDLRDIRQIHALAREVAGGTSRRATLVSMDELRALAGFAADAGDALFCAIEMFAASDFKDKDDVKRKLRRLAALSRPFFRSVA